MAMLLVSAGLSSMTVTCWNWRVRGRVKRPRERIRLGKYRDSISLVAAHAVGLPTRAPTNPPYVLRLEHTVLPMMDSPYSECGPWLNQCKSSRERCSKLNSMGLKLAVNASQDGSPCHHARLASGRWTGATGRAFHPQGAKSQISEDCFPTLFEAQTPPKTI